MKAKDYPFESVRISCSKCGRHGQYSRAAFVEMVGAETELPDALARISADCPKRQTPALVSSPAIPVSHSRDKPSASRKSPSGWASAMCWKAACRNQANDCALRPSLSMPLTASTFGPNGMIISGKVYEEVRNKLIREHGEDAALEAAQRADAMLEKGAIDGQRVWKRVLKAIKEIQREELGPEELLQ